MIASTAFDPVREATELRSQLASEKRRIAFLFGAGTSQAVGLDGLVRLTSSVQADLAGEGLKAYKNLLSLDKNGNIETILNRLRITRELVGSDATRAIDGLSAQAAANLERQICSSIQERVGIEPPGGLVSHFTFAHWVKSLDRSFPVEIFTTNYDVLLERGLESAETPYFDGFVGSGETLLIVAGYSFSDQHINEILFQGLRSNSRLAITVLLFEPIASPHIQDNLLRPTLGSRNLTIYGPDAASVGGREGPWQDPKEAPPLVFSGWPFWDSHTKRFTMSDFRTFVDFLKVFMGVRTPALSAPEAATSENQQVETSSAPSSTP